MSRSSALPFAAAVALLALSGCSYTSAYVPPADGRARVLWDGKQTWAGLPELGEACRMRVQAVSAEKTPVWNPLAPPTVWWEPDDDDEDVVDHTGARADVDVSYGGRGHHAGGAGFRHGMGHIGGGHGHGFGGGGHIGGGHAGGGHGGGGGGGGGGGNWGKGAIAIVVLAYFIVPTVVAVWSAQTPEETYVARSMDEVHAYNDLVRSGDPACAGPP